MRLNVRECLEQYGTTKEEIENILYDQFDDALCVCIKDNGQIAIKSIMPHTSETVGW